MEVFMAKLSDESKKKIAEGVKRSWTLRRARMAAKAGAKTRAKTDLAGVAATPPAGKGRRRLSASAKRRIADAVKRAWAVRRAGKTTGAGAKVGRVSPAHGLPASIQAASAALRSLTLDDLRPLAGRQDAAKQLEELAGLASDLRRLLAR
jgi:hypothetical protein